jgi:hypothetical protein
LWVPANGEWYSKLWKWQLELKLKCFFLAAFKKENSHLGRSGGSRMGRAKFLCLVSQQSGDRPPSFCYLPLYSAGLDLFRRDLKYFTEMGGHMIEECLSVLEHQHLSMITLPTVVCWCIWLDRNNIIFNGGSTLPLVVAKKSLLSFKASKVFKGKKLQ